MGSLYIGLKEGRHPDPVDRAFYLRGLDALVNEVHEAKADANAVRDEIDDLQQLLMDREVQYEQLRTLFKETLQHAGETGELAANNARLRARVAELEQQNAELGRERRQAIEQGIELIVASVTGHFGDRPVQQEMLEVLRFVQSLRHRTPRMDDLAMELDEGLGARFVEARRYGKSWLFRERLTNDVYLLCKENVYVRLSRRTAKLFYDRRL